MTRCKVARELLAIVREVRADGFDQFRETMGAEAVDGFLSSFGLGPNYVPPAPKTYACPQCGGAKATCHEEGADTDYNEMVLECPDCGWSGDPDTVTAAPNVFGEWIELKKRLYGAGRDIMSALDDIELSCKKVDITQPMGTTYEVMFHAYLTYKDEAKNRAMEVWNTIYKVITGLLAGTSYDVKDYRQYKGERNSVSLLLEFEPKKTASCPTGVCTAAPAVEYVLVVTTTRTYRLEQSGEPESQTQHFRDLRQALGRMDMVHERNVEYKVRRDIVIGNSQGQDRSPDGSITEAFIETSLYRRDRDAFDETEKKTIFATL
jgi:hypothetical protein